jgi:serine/threonine-protein kinase
VPLIRVISEIRGHNLRFIRSVLYSRSNKRHTFHAQRELAADMQAQHRFNAACAAALAGSGHGKDGPPLDEMAKARWRKRAVEWLKADLAFWTKQAESGPPQARRFVVQTLQHWKADADLAGIRDQAALANIPGGEQKAYRALWAEVDALLRKSQEAKH